MALDNRDNRMDNLRCVLIVLVVFGHLAVRFSEGPIADTLYQVIYVFHMPVFVFVSGYFARWRPAKVARNLLIPYVEFQLLATAYVNFQDGRFLLDGFTLLKPEWTLWYLLACMMWYATCPLLDRARNLWTRCLVVGVALAVSVAVGFVPWVSKTLSLSRVVVFYPFFCAGFYAGKLRISQRVTALDPRRHRWLAFACLVAVILLMWAHFAHGACPNDVLHRSVPYKSRWDCTARAILQLAAFAWCALLLVVTPNRDLGRATTIGRNTMSVYLLHSWVIRALLQLEPPLPEFEVPQLLLCAGAAVVISILLGNERVSRAVCWWNRL